MKFDLIDVSLVEKVEDFSSLKLETCHFSWKVQIEVGVFLYAH